MPNVSVDGSEQPILCGLCRAPISFRIEGDTNGEAGCAACDNWADLEEVVRIVTENFKDEAQLALNRMAQKAANRSKLLHFTGETVNHKAYRFLVDLKL